MIHKNQIAQMARKIMRRQAGGLHDYQIMHPMRDWIIGISIAVSIFLIGAAVSAQIYFSNVNTLLESEASGEEVVVYRESAVQAALLRLKERDAAFQQLQGGQIPVVIPESVLPAEASTTTPIESEATTTVPVNDEGDTDDTIIPAPL